MSEYATIESSTLLNLRNDIDVLDKYESLIKSSLGANSVYIRTKETLEELSSSGYLSDADKAKVVSEVLTNLNTAIVNSSMSTAMQWAKAEKDVQLKRIELDKQLKLLAEETAIKAAQAKDAEAAFVRTKADTWANYGVTGYDAITGTVIKPDSISVLAGSKVGADIALTGAQTSKVGVEKDLTTRKIAETDAAVYKIVADTATNYGNVTYSINSDTGAVNVFNIADVLGHNSLASIQAAIAKEQASGYAYNAWANAATASSSMLGALIASGSYTAENHGAFYNSIADTVLKLGKALPPYNAERFT
jgi:hypothetical protein